MILPRGDGLSCLLLTIIIGLISFVGDWLLYNVNSSTLCAISDNLTHALVGGMSWSLVIKLSKKSISRNVFGITVCFFISSFIDLDHFLLAKSWKLKDATHLGSRRPIFHNSLIPVLVWLIFEIANKIFHLNSTLGYYLWVIITGFITHHVRDATRRGLWFGFLGSTPPIPYYFYIFIAMLLPYFIYWLVPVDHMIKDCSQFLSVGQSQTVENDNCLSVYDV